MYTLGRFVSLTAVVAILLVGTSPAVARSPANTNNIVREPVTWTLPAGICAEAPAGLTGSGERHRVTNTKVNGDGSMMIIINDVVKGTAGDGTINNGSYRFIYENHSVEQIPVGGGAHQVSMEDSFVMNGKGNVSHMAVGFNWSWTYTPPDPLFTFGPDLQQHSTRGDPFTCDPL